MVGANPNRFRFSNDGPASGRRLARSAEGFDHRLMSMDLVDRSTTGLRFTVELVSLGHIAAGLVHATPSSFVCKRADDNRALFMLIGRQGGFAVSQHGQRHQLSNGAAAVFDHDRAGEIHCGGEGEAVILSLPRLALRHLVPNVDTVVERIIPQSHPALRLLTRYLEALLELDHIDDPHLAAVHVADLLASLLDRSDDARRPADRIAPRTARLACALDVIDLHLADPDLDPRRVAQALNCSVRYVHRLLEETVAVKLP